MNDSEIIKALECCTTTKGGCKECPMKGYEKVDCQLITATEAYKLINRQQAEITKMSGVISYLESAYTNVADEVKVKTVQEFAEKLKKIYAAHDGLAIVIDQLVEEMGCNDE